MRGVANDWIKSYLTSRKQFVNIDGHVSDLLDVTCGILQGSILSPRLFVLYVNDICNVSKLAKFILFTVNSNICCVGCNLLELRDMLNRELAKLCT